MRGTAALRLEALPTSYNESELDVVVLGRGTPIEVAHTRPYFEAPAAHFDL